jgi:hypothetical protein
MAMKDIITPSHVVRFKNVHTTYEVLIITLLSRWAALRVIRDLHASRTNTTKDSRMNGVEFPTSCN